MPERPVGAAGRASRVSCSSASRRARLPAPGGRLDQLDERPGGEGQLLGIRGALLGRVQRLLVAAEAVVQHRGRYWTSVSPDALAAASRRR